LEVARQNQQLRRRQIIGAMAQCVAEDGIDGATVRKVAERSGGTTGLVTYYYATKRELMRETLEAAHERVNERIEQLQGKETRQLQRLFEILVGQRDADTLPWSFWLDYWAHASREPGLREEHARHSAHLKATVQRLVESAIGRGLLRPDLPPATTANLLLSLLNGLGVQVALAQTLEDQRQAIEAVRLIFSLIAAPTAG
jgi:AcrR family transcriptional regulator